MNNMKPPQVASPPPVIKSSAKAEPPQLINQSPEATVPPPPPPSPKWRVVVLVILAVLAVLAVVVYLIAPNINESTKGPEKEPTQEDIIDQPPMITPDGISLDKDSLRFANIGESIQLTETVLPAEVSEMYKQVTWMSDNETVAKVDFTGVVTAVANGNAVVSAYTDNGFSANCYITVYKNVPPPPPTPTPVPTVKSQSLTNSEIISLFSEMSNSDKDAFDRFIKEVGTHIPVEGAENISNSYELAIDAYQGGNYSISIQRNNNGKISKIVIK